MNKFSKGNRVELININSRVPNLTFDPSPSNTVGNIGIIESPQDSSNMVSVNWDNGTSNCYYPQNLKLLSEDEDIKSNKIYKDE